MSKKPDFFLDRKTELDLNNMELINLIESNEKSINCLWDKTGSH